MNEDLSEEEERSAGIGGEMHPAKLFRDSTDVWQTVIAESFMDVHSIKHAV